MGEKKKYKGDEDDELDDLILKVLPDRSEFETEYNPKIPWSSFFYKIWFNVKRAFVNPFNSNPKKELNLLEQVDLLLQEDNPSDELIERCRKFIHLHRIVENTAARKRLERWTKKLITYYLLTIVLIVFLNSIEIKTFKIENIISFHVSDMVLNVILSTTTVNVIAIVLILMRGLFPHAKNSKEDDKTISSESSYDSKTLQR